MSVCKGNRKESKVEFDNTYFKVYEDCVKLTSIKFGAKGEIAEKYTQYIAKMSDTVSHGFTYMQIKYSIDGNKIIKRPTRSKITRERRRLKKYKKLCDDGKMSEFDIGNCYKSWRNNVIKDCNRCDKSIQRLDALYNELFPVKDKYKKPSRNNLINTTFNKEYSNETHYTYR